MILGKRTIGTTAFALGGDRKQLIDVTLARPGYLADMTVYLDGLGSGGSQPVLGVVYERTTNALVATGVAVVISPASPAAWRQLTFASHPLLAAGTYAIGVHAGPAGCARGFHSGGAGLTEADTYSNGPSATLTPTGTSTGLSVMVSASEPWTPPTTADDEYLASMAYQATQDLFGSGGPVDKQSVRVGWHGTRTDPATGSYAVVREGSALEDLLGERVKLTLGGQSTCVYIHDVLAIAEDISLTRRSFMALAEPSATVPPGVPGGAHVSAPVNAPGAAARAIRDMALRAAEHQRAPQQYAEVVNASPLNVQLASGLTLDDDDLVLGASVRSYDKGQGIKRGDTLVVVQMDNEDWIAVEVVTDVEITAAGVPIGGTTGQVLQKKTATDYDTQWTTPSGTLPTPPRR